jgi:hypothetical protein
MHVPVRRGAASAVRAVRVALVVIDPAVELPLAVLA